MAIRVPSQIVGRVLSDKAPDLAYRVWSSGSMKTGGYYQHAPACRSVPSDLHIQRPSFCMRCSPLHGTRLQHEGLGVRVPLRAPRRGGQGGGLGVRVGVTSPSVLTAVRHEAWRMAGGAIESLCGRCGGQGRGGWRCESLSSAATGTAVWAGLRATGGSSPSALTVVAGAPRCRVGRMCESLCAYCGVSRGRVEGWGAQTQRFYCSLTRTPAPACVHWGLYVPGHILSICLNSKRQNKGKQVTKRTA